jgi:hypothetical protein
MKNTIRENIFTKIRADVFLQQLSVKTNEKDLVSFLNLVELNSEFTNTTSMIFLYRLIQHLIKYGDNKSLSDIFFKSCNLLPLMFKGNVREEGYLRTSHAIFRDIHLNNRLNLIDKWYEIFPEYQNEMLLIYYDLFPELYDNNRYVFSSVSYLIKFYYNRDEAEVILTSLGKWANSFSYSSRNPIDFSETFHIKPILLFYEICEDYREEIYNLIEKSKIYFKDEVLKNFRKIK